MHYGMIYTADIANGTGCRTSLFVSGCTHRCPGCFNEETWDFHYGKPYTQETQAKILESLAPSWIDGLSLLGGEPMETVNQEALLPLVKQVHRMGKTIWVYSGYLWEELTDPSCRRCFGPYTQEFLSTLTILVDGEFVQEKKNISLRFRGSENQRILDVPASLKEGKAVLSDLMEERFRR